jgi:hypothetical protein
MPTFGIGAVGGDQREVEVRCGGGHRVEPSPLAEESLLSRSAEDDWRSISERAGHRRADQGEFLHVADAHKI